MFCRYIDAANDSTYNVDIMTAKTKIDAAAALFELVNVYPSPHNGQPIQLKRQGESAVTLFFERERGLQATDISYIFSFVSMGVFMRHFELAARALGHELTYKLALPEERELRGEGLIEFARADIVWDSKPKDPKLLTALQFRQTSRKKYTAGLPTTVIEEIISSSKARGLSLKQLDAQQARQAIWLNQRAVFDDMFDEPVRRELNHWLRYNQREKETKRDGLAYDCMELNGPVMKWIVGHPRILRWPGVSGLLKSYYLRTMTDASSVFYLMAPFGNGRAAFEVGLEVMELWIQISRHGFYLHPFGTIMSNQAAHRDFLRLAGVEKESREQSYLVFIFRAGRSEPPTPSLRLPYRQHLLME